MHFVVTLSFAPESNPQSVINSIINQAKPIGDKSYTNALIPAPSLRTDFADTKLPILQPNLANQNLRIPPSNVLIQAQDPMKNVISGVINDVQHNVEYPMSTPATSHILDTRNRYENIPLQLGYHSPPSIPSYSHVQPKKESVFLKVPTFELPKKSTSIIKPDVKPRRDFSNIQNLVKDYLDLRKYRMSVNNGLPKSPDDFRQYLKNSESNRLSKLALETYLNSAEEKVINYNKYSNKEATSDKPKHDIYSIIPSDVESKENSNDKLMKLLDKLEQEVKHIELDKNRKEIVDAKIRKIYGTVVGKTTLEKLHKPEKEYDLTDIEFSDHDNDRRRFSDLENNGYAKKERYHIIDGFESENYERDKMREHEKHPDPLNELRPITRTQNDISDRFNERSNSHHKKYKTGKDYEIEIKHPYSDNDNFKTTKYTHPAFTDDEDIKTRNIYNDKEYVRTRHLYSDADEKKKHEDTERRNHMVFSDHEDDPLGIDRRKYYQEKLDKIEKKIHSSRRLHHSDNPNHHLRPIIRPTTREEEPLRPGKGHHDNFYMPDRARFLHGF